MNFDKVSKSEEKKFGGGGGGGGGGEGRGAGGKGVDRERGGRRGRRGIPAEKKKTQNKRARVALNRSPEWPMKQELFQIVKLFY